MKRPSPSHQNTLLDELNTQRYTLTKTGRIALALAAHAAQQPTPSRPVTKTT